MGPTIADSVAGELRRLNRFVWTAVLVVTLGLTFRLALVTTWHVPAGDGLHYYSLSQELRARGRYAFGAPPQPLTYVRMPGYPLFLAYVAVCQAPLALELHLRRATRANVVLDVGTALLVLLMLRRLGARPALLGLVGVFLSPLLFLLACYGLSETLATFLSTLAMFAALRAWQGRLLAWAALAGVAAGLALLVRIDTVVLAPALALTLWLAPATRRLRLLALATTLLCALVVFAPWPLRNLRTFGAAHPDAVAWRRLDGKPLPNEIIDWYRTWAGSSEKESFVDLPFYFSASVNTRFVLLPKMWDDEDEHRRVLAVFDRYNREGVSPAVVDGFAELAQAHRRRHPFRFWLGLPALRVLHLFAPVPEWELPMRVKWLGMPAARPWLGLWDLLVYAAAIVGAIALVRRGEEQRRYAWVLLSWVAMRALLYSFAIPNATTQRYLIEAYPALLMLAAGGVDHVAAWSRRRRASTAAKSD
jgi:4-amino-4-deoxy-L-arabinose transferase-like glycosyltransferase